MDKNIILNEKRTAALNRKNPSPILPVLIALALLAGLTWTPATVQAAPRLKSSENALVKQNSMRGGQLPVVADPTQPPSPTPSGSGGSTVSNQTAVPASPVAANAVSDKGCTVPLRRIMPLGDSITRGTGSDPDGDGYRRGLFLSLVNTGYNVNFVGSKQDGSFDFDRDNEGHGGYMAEQASNPSNPNTIYPNVYNWLAANPADIVLLHIGTNDITENEPDARKIDDILNEIDRYSPSTSVILARITNMSKAYSSFSSAVTKFNSDVADLVANERSNDKILMVDMEHALFYSNNVPDDLIDGIHPNNSGYSKMAPVWAQKLYEILPICVGQDDVSLPEDSPTSLITLLANDVGGNNQITGVGIASHGTTEIVDNGSAILYSPAKDYNGSDTFSYTISAPAPDNGNFPRQTATGSVNVNVTPVNDPPSFTKGADQAATNGSVATTITGWATNISPGAGNESGQIVDFQVTNDNNSIFSSQPAISSDGTLTFTPATGALGVATVTVRLHDNGGTANGGVDTSDPQSFTIRIGPLYYTFLPQIEKNFSP